MDDKFIAIDLFAGAGGLSYGFEQEGIDVCLAIEKDTWACDTYRCNHQNKNVVEGDITQIPDDYFTRYRGNVDIVMGGPPCQGFSIAASNRRKMDDFRNTLYRHFLRVVKLVEPTVVLIENVKEIERYKLPDGTKIVADIEQFLANLGYVFDHQIVDCRNYGIPQDRRRFFFLAVKKQAIRQTIDIKSFLHRFETAEISFYEAIDDLPVVKPKQFPEDATMPYDQEPHNAYQRRMRGNTEVLHNHVPMRHTDKTVQKFEFILANHEQKTQLQLPDELKPRVRGNLSEISTSAYSQNHRIIDGNKVSPTITASFYSSFIHPTQPRNLTVREAARIQTFPDSFIFTGKKTTLSKKLLAKKGIFEELHLDQFNQVGNAVPPLMASHWAEICKEILERGIVK